MSDIKDPAEGYEGHPVGLAALRYMAEQMAMPMALEDQEQNWIFGHMYTFALKVAEEERAACERVVRGMAKHGRQWLADGSAAILEMAADAIAARGKGDGR